VCLRRLSPLEAAALERAQAIRGECGGNDAEALARLFEDHKVPDDGTPRGRVEMLLCATAHHWLPGLRGPLDVPGLCEIHGYEDAGFRQLLVDPWRVSRDQVGHFLTAANMCLHPEVVRQQRLGVAIRSMIGAAPEMPDSEVAMRLAIGHEKAPDPWRYNPFTPWWVRQQFRSAGDHDLAAFRAALSWAAEHEPIDVEALYARAVAIGPGTGTGNSAADLTLTLLGYAFAQRVQGGAFPGRGAMAAWIRAHIAAPHSSTRLR
jgi:hypothetical protein